MTWHLCGQAKQGQTRREDLCPGAVVLRGFAVPDATAIFAALHGITTQAPFRHAVSGRLGCHQLEVGKS
jgi:DNA oxidative demethylase